jgi:hypothetical protein
VRFVKRHYLVHFFHLFIYLNLCINQSIGMLESKLSLFHILIYKVPVESAWTHIWPESVPYIKTENKFTSMYVRKHSDFEVNPTFVLFKPFGFISMWTLNIRSIFSCKLNRQTFCQRILVSVKPFTITTGHLKFSW